MTAPTWIRQWPSHGRPVDVLEFIDRVLDPRRPLIFNANSVSSMAQAYPAALAGLRATEERLREAQERYDAINQIIEGLQRLEDLDA